MSNTRAIYKDTEALGVVSQWFETAHNNDFTLPGEFVTLDDLYQSYCEYTIGKAYIPYRMTLSQFAKCLVACKIIDIGGRWRYAEEYEPSKYQLTRTTA